jgi:hypothetical protein
MGDEAKDTQDARAYDERGNVRPADGRMIVQTAEEQAKQREAEIQAGYAKLEQDKREEDERNQKALEESGYVNPTVAPSEHAEARNAAADAPAPDPASDGDRYDGMDYRSLQAEAATRDGVQGNLPQDDLRAALRADDASKNA